MTVTVALLAVARAKAEAMTLANKRLFKEAARVLVDAANLFEGLELDDPRVAEEITALRERAKELLARGEEFYSPVERKRMYYEASLRGTGKDQHFASMMKRRK